MHTRRSVNGLADLSTKLLIACSQLRRSDYDALWGRAPEIERGLDEAARERLALARAFADAATRLADAACRDDSVLSDIDARNAVSRSYYACHHAARALALFRDRGDEPHHRRAIKCLARTVRAERKLQSKLGEAEDVEKRLEQLLHHRHLADYHPYGASAAREAPLDFVATAHRAAAWAQKVVDTVEAFFQERESERP